MAGRRVTFVLGGSAVAAGTYYLYNAGGDPKVAEKQAEHDAARLSSKIKGDIPSKENEAKTQVKVFGEQAGSKIDSAMSDAKSYVNKADSKFDSARADAEKKIDEYKKTTGTELNKAVDKFDKSVEEGAAKSKSWIGSLFGGK